MIAISAGHYPNAPGACWEGICEHEIAREWVRMICASYRDVFLEVPVGHLRGKVDFINRNDCQMAVEVHFNSASGHGNGFETLYCPGSTQGKQCAEIINESLIGIFSPNRGVKEGWYRMDRPGVNDYPGDVDGDEKPDYFLRMTKCPAVIVEPEFIHNYYLKILPHETEACEALAKAILRAYNECV